MASTYSPSLRIELIGTGDQSGLWGDTTNTNLGSIIEQAITGVQSIPMTDADYTLTALNGSVDEARNAVIVMTSIASLTATRSVFIPAQEKLYTVKNSTAGNQNIVVKTPAGVGYTVPNGQTAVIYCNGTDCFQGLTYLVSPSFTGTPTATTASAGTDSTQIATTAFVNTAVTNAVTSAVFPVGTKLMFAQAAAPTGWTQVTTDSANNRMLRVVSSTGAGTGGSASPILMDVVPSHTHTYSGTSSGQSQSHTHSVSGTSGAMSANATHSHGVSDPGHTHYTTIRYMGGTGTGGTNVDLQGGGGSNVNVSGYDTMSSSGTGISINSANIDHTHTFSATSASASVDHTHTYSGTSAANGSASNWAPRYLDMILCSKN